MDEKDKALKKLRNELNKDINKAIDMAKYSNTSELLYFVYLLHVLRVIRLLPDKKIEGKDNLDIYICLIEESLKYIISLVVKYGKRDYAILRGINQPSLNVNSTQSFLKHSNYINSKFEAIGMFQLFDVQVSGERDQYVKTDMSVVESDPDIKKLFEYFFRIEINNNFDKSNIMKISKMIEFFKKEYNPVSDLFKLELGISIEEFCWFIEQLSIRVTDKIKIEEPFFKTYPNGNLDMMNEVTYMHFSKCLIHNKKDIINSFGEKYSFALKRLTFKSDEFNERQLRFHHLTRKPLIEFKEVFVISPELLLDSLFINTHYSLVESKVVRQEYIDKKAKSFIDEIVLIANRYGYKEVEREKELYENKNQIGDIDLILKNGSGNFLLIEGKNHALPLDVYFKDVLKTKEHLSYLQNEWEKKVIRRVNHLRSEYRKYSISKEFSYIVVSRFPEIISHYSDLFILSKNEFEEWLKDYQSIRSFNDFYDIYYDKLGVSLTKDEFEELQKSNLIFGKFEKK